MSVATVSFFKGGVSGCHATNQVLDLFLTDFEDFVSMRKDYMKRISLKGTCESKGFLLYV